MSAVNKYQVGDDDYYCEKCLKYLFSDSGWNDGDVMCQSCSAWFCPECTVLLKIEAKECSINSCPLCYEPPKEKSVPYGNDF